MKVFLSTLIATSFAATVAMAAAGSGTTTGSSTGGSSSGNTPSLPAPAKKSPLAAHCKAGEVVKAVKKHGKSMNTCVKVQSGLLDDRDLYHQGWVLAKAGEYDWAIQVLSSVKEQNTPDVLTMLGYSNRKAGRVDVGFSYYNKALALDPNFARAREYLGEGYVSIGKMELAKAELEKIKGICGTTCEEYKDLSEAIGHG